MPFPPNREELARAAGFFNGEGCTCVDKYANRAYLRISISQVERECLDQFNQAIGGFARIGRQYNPTHFSHPYPVKQQWPLKVNGFERVQATVAMLWPWLSTSKKEQYKAALSQALNYYQGEAKGELPSL